MVSEDVNIILKVDTEQPRTEIEDLENEVDKVASIWQRVKLTVRREALNIGRSIAALVRSAQTILRAIGVSLGDMGDAILNIVEGVISSVIAMRYAYIAGGPVGWSYIVLTYYAMVMAAGAQVSAARGVKEAKQRADASAAALRSLTSVIGPWL
jgi:hypothetical protein